MNHPIEPQPALSSATRGQRVLPLPLALVALSIPLLAAWSADDSFRGNTPGAAIQGSQAEARPLDEPFVLLGRDVRLPEAPGGYVDVWAEPQGWEVGVLSRADKR